MSDTPVYLRYNVLDLHWQVIEELFNWLADNVDGKNYYWGNENGDHGGFFLYFEHEEDLLMTKLKFGI